MDLISQEDLGDVEEELNSSKTVEELAERVKGLRVTISEAADADDLLLQQVEQLAISVAERNGWGKT